MSTKQQIEQKQLNNNNYNNNALQIYCRLRPLDNDADEGDVSCSNEQTLNNSIQHKSDTVLSLRKPNSFLEQQYLFEKVFSACVSQREVFTHTTVPLIESLLSGQDGLLFAYGSTSSGKSYTIGGLPNQPGIIPRSIDYLFGTIGGSLNKDFLILPDTENFYIVNNRASVQVLHSYK